MTTNSLRNHQRAFTDNIYQHEWFVDQGRRWISSITRRKSHMTESLYVGIDVWRWQPLWCNHEQLRIILFCWILRWKVFAMSWGWRKWLVLTINVWAYSWCWCNNYESGRCVDLKDTWIIRIRYYSGEVSTEDCLSTMMVLPSMGTTHIRR